MSISYVHLRSAQCVKGTSSRVRTSPIAVWGTSVGTPGGSLAEQDESQERIEVMPNAGSRANPTLPPVLGDGPARLLHLRDTLHGAHHRTRARLEIGRAHV